MTDTTALTPSLMRTLIADVRRTHGSLTSAQVDADNAKRFLRSIYRYDYDQIAADPDALDLLARIEGLLAEVAHASDTAWYTIIAVEEATRKLSSRENASDTP